MMDSIAQCIRCPAVHRNDVGMYTDRLLAPQSAVWNRLIILLQQQNVFCIYFENIGPVHIVNSSVSAIVSRL